MKSPVQAWRLAWTLLRRDARAGELRVLIAALTVAVGAVAAVGFFTDRLERALSLQANELLGADLVLTSDRPVPGDITRMAHSAGLQTTEVLSFPSMVMSDGQAQLASIKAVGAGFPRRGQMRIADAPFAPERVTTALPPRGGVWLEPRLIAALNAAVGKYTRVGNSELRIGAVLTHEPGRGGDFFSIAPQVLMNLDDLPATQLLQPASRVEYRLLIAGEPPAVRRFRDAISVRLTPGQALQGVQDARPEIRAALSRAGQFLGLAAVTSVILAGIAIALAARRFVQRHLDACAIMRCLGASQNLILRLYIYQLTLLSLFGIALGLVVGYSAHWVIIEILGQTLNVAVPAPSVWPVLGAVATGVVAVAGFAIPPLLQLRNVPALRVLRRELGGLQMPGVLTYSSGVAAIAGLIFWQAGGVVLGAIVALGIALGIALLAGIAGVLIVSMRAVQRRGNGAWLFGVSNITRRAFNTVVQVVAFGLGLMILLLLTVVRNDLLESWQKTLPADAPNRFLINIQTDQLGTVRDLFARQGLPAPALYPMVRGRLVAINGAPLALETLADERARRLATREFNLSWTAHIDTASKIVAGVAWQGATPAPQWSVEEGIAKTLGIKLGDRLRYDIAGQTVEAPVTSLRSVQWDSFRANFFVLASPGLLDASPATYMTSFYLTTAQAAWLNTVVQTLPNVTVIDVAAIMQQVRGIMDRVSAAVEFVFLFCLFSGVTVLLAGIQATHDERVLENAILRTLGGRTAQLLRALSVEFLVVGALSGGVAALLASVIAAVVAVRVLEVPWHINPWLWLVGLLGGAITVGVAGLLGSRKVLTRPPLEVLRGV
ncbi:MAG: FtsX-like permease family protein [Pseudomonadota bacterium]